MWLKVACMFAFFLMALATLPTTPYQRLVERLKNANALECRVAAGNHRQIRIIAARDGKIRMESAERTIVSNGTTVWNYLPSRKTVTIAWASTAGATFDRIAFELINKYHPVEQNTTCVVLRPTGEPRYGVQQIVLEFRQHHLRTITITHATGTEHWVIRSLRFNPPLSTNTFEFTVPAGVEIVDLR